ncbi:uncharacterized protein LOC134259645 [Saccostrea cucullata]|uniref:uncharacterized protein LOC134259645 n=1 Tax=Saccostrea cuccullata TaxID=36930 RepID=UPI002ED5D5E1
MKRQSREISSKSMEATSSSLGDTLPRPIFHFKSNKRVYNCTCKWVYDWHKRLNFPCHQAAVYSRHFRRQHSTPSNLKLLHLGEVENGEPKNIEKTDEHYKELTNSERETSESTDSEQIDTEEEEPIPLQRGLEGDEEISNEKVDVNIDHSTNPEDETGDQGKMVRETLLYDKRVIYLINIFSSHQTFKDERKRR